MKKLASILILLLLVSSLFAQQKFALVIGNSNYTGISKLTNPVNDADDIAATLQSMGFTVDKILDGNLDQMEQAVSRLKNRLSVSSGSYGFFFYAGHGVQSNGVNYLIPIGASIPGENYLRDRAVSVQTVLSELNDAKNTLNIVVLDACRDNPFGWARSGSRGLTTVSHQPADSIIVYATSAGSTAADGTGRNGLFTTHLLNNLKQPGLEVKEVFNRTGLDVSRASNRQQIPAVYNQFFETAYLGTRPSVSPTIQPEVVQSVPVGLEFEIKDGRSVTITKYTGDAATVNIPERIQGLPVTVIQYVAFSLRENLTSISIPSTVTAIDDSAFYINNNLTSITVDSRNSSYTSVDGVLFDKNIRTIIRYPQDKNGTNYVIPSSVTAIGANAFYQCRNLTSINIPSSVTTIGYNAFGGNNLTSITVDSRNASYTDIDGVLFDKNKTTLILYPSEKKASTYSIPSSVMSIGNFAFSGCRNLISISIPSSVTSIGNFTFSRCSSLTSVTLSRRTQVGENAFPDSAWITYRD
jgi:hypothetical protein